VDTLFGLFHGSAPAAAAAQQGQQQHLPADRQVQPASPALRGKLLSLFVKSVAAANRFPVTFDTVRECVFGAGASSRLKQQGMEFAVWVFKHAQKEQLQQVGCAGCARAVWAAWPLLWQPLEPACLIVPATATAVPVQDSWGERRAPPDRPPRPPPPTQMGPEVLQGLLQSLDLPPGTPPPSDTHSLAVRGFAYQALGQLATRLPALFAGSADVAARFFGALASEPAGLRATVQVRGLAHWPAAPGQELLQRPWLQSPSPLPSLAWTTGHQTAAV
jgi:hypothetical protein